MMMILVSAGGLPSGSNIKWIGWLTLPKALIGPKGQFKALANPTGILTDIAHETPALGGQRGAVLDRQSTVGPATTLRGSVVVSFPIPEAPQG
jgi:hypothetical protein